MGWRLRLSDKTVRKFADLPIYCQQQKCSPGNVVSGSIRFMQIFAGVRWRGDVKWEWGSWKWRFSLLSFTVFRTFYIHGHTTAFRWYDCNELRHISRSLDCFTSNLSKTVCDTAKVKTTNRKSYTSFRLVPFLMTLHWRSFQPRLSFPRPFQQSLACFRVARSPSNSWASCFVQLNSIMLNCFIITQCTTAFYKSYDM